MIGPVLTSPLTRAFAGPLDHEAEEAVVRWLLSPEIGAVIQELQQLSSLQVRQLGATLDAFNSMYPHEPRSQARDLTLMSARSLALNELAFLPHGSSLQETWCLESLAIPPNRLQVLVARISRQG